MIKFFRQIRQRLLSENRFTKYLIYAVGEIILVVIGILIALQINNRNQERQDQEKVTAILSDVRDEIQLNIRETVNLIEFYREKDSIVAIVLSKGSNPIPFNRSMINPNSANMLWALPTISEQVYFTDKAFTNLANNTDILPEAYDGVFTKLYELYSRNQSAVQSLNEEMREKGIMNVKEREQHEWYSASPPPFQNEGFIEYVLNDYRYKNKVRIVWTDGIIRHLKSAVAYRAKALECLKELNEQLGTNDLKNQPKTKQTTHEFYLGKWMVNGNQDFVLEVYEEDERLFYTTSMDSERIEVLPLFNNSSSLFEINGERGSYYNVRSIQNKLYLTNSMVTLELEKMND